MATVQLREFSARLQERDRWLQLKRDVLRRSLALLKIRRNELVNLIFTFYPLQAVPGRENEFSINGVRLPNSDYTGTWLRWDRDVCKLI